MICTPLEGLDPIAARGWRLYGPHAAIVVPMKWVSPSFASYERALLVANSMAKYPKITWWLPSAQKFAGTEFEYLRNMAAAADPDAVSDFGIAFPNASIYVHQEFDQSMWETLKHEKHMRDNAELTSIMNAFASTGTLTKRR